MRSGVTCFTMVAEHWFGWAAMMALLAISAAVSMAEQSVELLAGGRLEAFYFETVREGSGMESSQPRRIR